MSEHGGLRDRFGRVATDLRVSLTDRCSLRCTYCMPAEGLTWLRPAERLTDDEIVRLVAVFVRLGVRTVRLTGGEPLTHPTTVDLTRRVVGLGPEVALTTNGVTLARHARALAAAGLARVNVSLDTLDPARFAELTRRDRLPDVLAGIAAAADAGLAPLKVNSVLVRDRNLDEAPALLDWALRAGHRLRFIEHMPLDADQTWDRSDMVTADEVQAVLADAGYRLAPHGGRGSAPAEEFDVIEGPDHASWGPAWPGGVGPVGIIASVTRPFCRDCDRLRLTADGQLRTCLFAHDETDLRSALHAGAADDELAAMIITAVAGKQAGHGIDAAGFAQPARTMSAIGG